MAKKYTPLPPSAPPGEKRYTPLPPSPPKMTINGKPYKPLPPSPPKRIINGKPYTPLPPSPSIPGVKKYTPLPPQTKSTSSMGYQSLSQTVTLSNGGTEVEIDLLTGNISRIRIRGTTWLDSGLIPNPPKEDVQCFFESLGENKAAPFSMELFLNFNKRKDPLKRLRTPVIKKPASVEEIYIKKVNVVFNPNHADTAEITWTVTGLVAGNNSFGNPNSLFSVMVQVLINEEGYVQFGHASIDRPDPYADYHDFGIYSFRYPILRGILFPDNTDDDHSFVVFPYKDGRLLSWKNLKKFFSGGLSDIYPHGYGMTMQFLGLYGTQGGSRGMGWGIYLGAHDSNLYSKSFFLKSTNDIIPTFDFYLTHYNDDVCKGYVLSDDNVINLKYNPIWKNFQQVNYWLTLRVVDVPSLGNIMTWCDIADIYKAWAREQVWAKIDRYERDRKDIHFGSYSFYNNIGLLAGFIGSEMELTQPDGYPNRNYLKYIHNILKRDASNDAKVLFLMAWDWHYPFEPPRLAGGSQFGNSQRYWTARYGGQRNYRANYDYIHNTAHDFIVPYILEYRMSAEDYPGWLDYFSDDFGSPWFRNRIAEVWVSLRLDIQRLCPASEAFAAFFQNRRDLIQNAMIDPNGPKISIDGIHHDDGFCISGHACFNCEDQAHKHNGIFQVGVGGFLCKAKRNLSLINMYGQAKDFQGKPRKLICSIEGMVEFLIDTADCFTSVDAWGPYKSIKDMVVQSEGTYQEIPLIQYVYNPIMPIHGQNITLSGGDTPSGQSNAPQPGDAYYWLAAQTYLNGMVLALSYDSWPIDIFWQGNNRDLNMESTTSAYVIGWNRNQDDPNTPPAPVDHSSGDASQIFYWLYDSGLGKHEWHPNSLFQQHCRTYVDYKKYLYLRMLAYMRLSVIPKFLIYGDMLRPPRLTDNDITRDLSYSYYWCLYKGDDAHKKITQHIGNPFKWETNWQPSSTIITSSWRERLPMVNGMPPINLPFRVVCLVANVDMTTTSTRMVNFMTDIDWPWDDVHVETKFMIMKRDYESTWDPNAWLTRISDLRPWHGRISITEHVTLAPGEVFILMISPKNFGVG